MKISIRADEVQAGDIHDGKVIQVVDVSDKVTMIHFGLKEPLLPLLNTAEILVERKIEKIDSLKP